MAQGLFCTLLIGTILNTVGAQFHIGVLTREIVNIAGKGYSIGSLAQVMAGPAMAVGIGAALKAPIMVLLTLAPVGFATNALGGAGGPFAVYAVAIIASEAGKAISKETNRSPRHSVCHAEHRNPGCLPDSFSDRESGKLAGQPHHVGD